MSYSHLLSNEDAVLLFRDVSKFAMHFIVEEIDEDTSMEELQKMMLVALVYRILVCLYEVRSPTHQTIELEVSPVSPNSAAFSSFIKYQVWLLFNGSHQPLISCYV